jgi:hypothetical protein
VTVFHVASKRLVGSWAVESPEAIPVLLGRMKSS